MKFKNTFYFIYKTFIIQNNIYKVSNTFLKKSLNLRLYVIMFKIHHPIFSDILHELKL